MMVIITSGHSNLTNRPYHLRSIVFTRLHQYALHLIMLPWTHPSAQTKRHIDRFSHFAGFNIVADRPTDRTRSILCNTDGHPHVTISITCRDHTTQTVDNTYQRGYTQGAFTPNPKGASTLTALSTGCGIKNNPLRKIKFFKNY